MNYKPGARCGICDFYVGSKTMWPDIEGRWYRTESQRGCSKDDDLHTRPYDEPCGQYQSTWMAEKTRAGQ